jgi:5-hydroxyisourate hydrolase-like protein (transthyretin family)
LVIEASPLRDLGIGYDADPMHLRTLVSGALLALAGCAHSTGLVDTDDGLDPKSAYLYGRFGVDAQDQALAFAAHESIEFVFKCDARETPYRIRFSNDETDLQVIRIKPSRCEFVEVVCTDADGMTMRRISMAPGSLRNGVFRAGHAYYLGDFYGRASTRSTPIPFGTRVHWRWAITDVQDAYPLTTAAMRRNYPSLSRLPTEDRMLGN